MAGTGGDVFVVVVVGSESGDGVGDAIGGGGGPNALYQNIFGKILINFSSHSC